jgi:hypothetical protein
MLVSKEDYRTKKDKLGKQKLGKQKFKAGMRDET